MKKIALLLFIVLYLTPVKVSASDIFNHPISAEEASRQLPHFESKTCKFAQNKHIKSSKINITSSGNFQFIKDKGIKFETTYPIQSTTSYTTSDNKQVNSIIKSVINKNFSYIEKNFDLYYTKLDSSKWVFALKPKTKSPMSKNMKNLLISGENTNNKGIITQMIISTDHNITTIKFTQCT